MSEPRLPTLRRRDYSLSEPQQHVRDAFVQFFAKECPTSLVRDADPLAFDELLWQKVRDLGVTTMSLPEALGGDGAGLVDMTLVLEARGERIAPVPIVEHVVALRALAAVGADDEVMKLSDGGTIATVVPLAHRNGARAIVPGGAIAGAAVALLDDALVLVEPAAPAPLADTLGGAPLGWLDLRAHVAPRILARGEAARTAFDRMVLEWKVLVAASLVGLAQGALDITVRYANERIAFGVPIGTFQALSHPLADVRIAIEGARRMVWRAAWYLDREPEQAAVHVLGAYVHACETATSATAQGIHTQGGFGFTLESDLHLYFRRAKSWALVAGDPQSDLAAIADLTFGPTRKD